LLECEIDALSRNYREAKRRDALMLAQAFHDPKSLSAGAMDDVDEGAQSQATLSTWVQAARDRAQRRKLLKLQQEQQNRAAS